MKFIGVISTRKMKKITRDLFGKGYSASTISKINKQLTEEMRAWMEAPIEDNIKYIYLGGLNLPVKRFAVSKESLLMAVGITTDGYRLILAGIFQRPEKTWAKGGTSGTRHHGRFNWFGKRVSGMFP